MAEKVFVYLDTNSKPMLAGTAFLEDNSTVFAYSDNYLAWDGAYALSPDLPLVVGQQYSRGMPGCLSVSLPDRWGRNLIRKAWAGRRIIPSEPDYLLNVSDVTRTGALRFTKEEGGPFLGEGAEIPKAIMLPELLHAATLTANGDGMAGVKELLAAGSGSLGGGRPKASVWEENRQWLAKFPHPADEWDVMALEKTALDLAALAGIQVPENRLANVGGKNVLLVRRFDREAGRRIGYLSALTLLGAKDMETFDYLDIAAALPDVASQATRDLAELWKRIAFTLAVNNLDDHLRNHGFLRDKQGWRLSPLFDVNPEPDQGYRRTSIAGETSRSKSIAALLASKDDFGLTAADAAKALGEVNTAIERWQEIARMNGFKPTARFEAAFRKLG
jgi:serine/threonine-protein kinase HipA